MTMTETELEVRPWVIDWRGSRLSSGEVTVGHYSLAVMLASDSWSIDPRSSPSNLIAWVIVAVCSETGREVEDVQAELSAAPMSELLRAVGTE
jgi:hypothetical protein